MASHNSRILSSHAEYKVVTPVDCFYKMTTLNTDRKLVDEEYMVAQQLMRLKDNKSPNEVDLGVRSSKEYYRKGGDDSIASSMSYGDK